jgi:hypothetical protein
MPERFTFLRCPYEKSTRPITKYCANSKPVWTAGKGDPNQPLNEEYRRPPSWFAFHSRQMSREELIFSQVVLQHGEFGGLTNRCFLLQSAILFFPRGIANQYHWHWISFNPFPFSYILLRAVAQFNAVYGDMNKKGLVFLERLPSCNKKGSPTRTWITSVVQVETTPPLQKSTNFKLNRSTTFHCWTHQFWGNFVSNLHVQNWINLLQSNLI